MRFSEDNPWFIKKKPLRQTDFRGQQIESVRQSLLQEKWIRKLPMKEYAEEAYEKAVRETPCCTEDSPVEKRRREIAYLNLKWFMATLLDGWRGPVPGMDCRRECQ